MVSAFPSVDLKKKKLSSANNKWELGAPLQILQPWRSLLRSAWSIRDDHPSKQIINKQGDNGSPCRRPRHGVIGHANSPFIETLYFTVVT